MAKEIKLSGGEISMLKALGLSGSPLSGHLFMARMKELEPAEFLDTLKGLLMMDYVMSSKVSIVKIEEVSHASFRVNPTHSRDLRNALRPGGRRDDDRERRRRRG